MVFITSDRFDWVSLTIIDGLNSLLVMKIEDKIKLLKSELQELNDELQKSESEYNASSAHMEIIKGMNTSDKKNLIIYHKMMKESFATELELLRIKIKIIRKISPETADFLDAQVNNYESAVRGLLDIVMNNPPEDVKLDDLLNYLRIGFEMATRSRLHDLVNISRNCIRDTLKRLEDTKLTD